jgi:DNA polymerase alpha subunit A
MIVSTTWSLTEMCKTYLKSERQDIDPDDTAGYFDGSVSSPDRLLTFVRHCELDAHYQMAITAKVQILPLTKQLTNLAGNSWLVLIFYGSAVALNSISVIFYAQEQDTEWWSRGKE